MWNLNRTVAGKKTQTADIDPIMNYRFVMSSRIATSVKLTSVNLSTKKSRQSFIRPDFKTEKQNSALRRESGPETGFETGQSFASTSCHVLKPVRESVSCL